MRLLTAVVAAGLAVAAAPLGHATELGLTASAARDVANDRFVARLEARASAPEPAAAQAALNALAERALAAVADTPAVTVATAGYAVRPEQAEDAPARWLATQALQLESAERTAMLEAVGALQELGLATRALGARLSDARAEEVREELLREAIAAMERRAEVAAAALGLAHVGWLSVRLDGARPMPRAMQADTATARAAGPPVLTVGETTVRVSVEGTAELAAQPER